MGRFARAGLPLLLLSLPALPAGAARYLEEVLAWLEDGRALRMAQAVIEGAIDA